MRLRPDHTLIVYGSLAPGKANHKKITHIQGVWFNGFVYGELEMKGWGADLGHPGLIISGKSKKQKISVSILKSKQLPDFWRELDSFEGQEYERILIEYETEAGLKGIGNIYALKIR